MSSLFFRIWLANWLVFLAVIALSVWTIDSLHNWKNRYSSQHFHTLLQDAKTALLNAEIAAEKKGEHSETPATWLNTFADKERFLLLDDRGKDVLQRPLPKLPNRGMPGPPPDVEIPPFRRQFSTSIAFKHHATHTLMFIPAQPRAFIFFFSPLVLVFFAFVGSGFAAMGLARYISNPIKQLLLASKKISRGEFKSNVAASVGNRKDEIADLARRFDEMTQALETAKNQQDSLLRDVSHELRSPLTRLTLIFDLLNDASEEERLRLHCRLKKELHALEILIDEVMSLAHFKAEVDSLKFEYCDLITTLSPVIEDARFEADALNKAVIFNHQNGEHPARISNIHFCRAIENILRNAIRHTPEHGKVKLTLSRQNDTWLIGISDEGPGVNEDELKDIFRPFYRSRDVEQEHKGKGIGLALAQSIVHAHHGNIFATNGLPANANPLDTHSTTGHEDQQCSPLKTPGKTPIETPIKKSGLHIYIQIPA